ncbi:MAG: hypothetical protein K5866_11200 [Treponema sp.]|nr:hypothetical protein [Treponema sp.]
MFLLIPHKDLELRLVKIQKKIINDLDCKKYIPFQSFPLWLPLNNLLEEDLNIYQGIKNLKDNIEAISIQKILCKNKSVDLEILIKYQKKEYRIDLPIVRFLNSTEGLQVSQFTEYTKELPQKINIFRIGFSENYREESHSEVRNFSLVTSEWKKIKD